MTWQTKDLPSPAWNSGGGKGGGDRDERESFMYTEPPASTAPAISLDITEIACGLSGFS